MTKREDVWNLLQQRLDTWVTRSEIDFVGGLEGSRRLRELRQVIPGGYVLDERTDSDGHSKMYRLRKVDQEPIANDPYYRCNGCGVTRRKSALLASIDQRYRIGHCNVCKGRAIWTAPQEAQT